MEEKNNQMHSDSPQPADQQTSSPMPISPTNAIILGLMVVIIIMTGFMLDGEETAVMTTAAAMPAAVPAPAQATTPTPSPAVTRMANTTAEPGGIERHGEGRLFYRTIMIPAGAETLYLSGSGASQKEDGTWGNMEEQAIDTFTKFSATLEEEGWSMSDIVQVRAFAVAGEYGLLDFDGFNRGYSRFFGTEENPNKPVRSFVQVADLVVDGWLVELEIRAARLPKE